MVEFSGVSKVYSKTFEALKNVNLSINDGEFVFVVGASGAGKSTFLKLIMREEVPSSGTVTINGYNLNRMKKRDIPYFRRTMGIVFQDFRLIPNMRVYDNVAFALRVTGTKEREVRKRVTHALGMVGLLSKTQSYPKELSGGEQQRVAIARALVNNADLIIADEPTGNIDPAMSVEIMDLLNHINKANGTTIVMVTHAHELVKQYDHRVVVLREGEIIADGYDKENILKLISPDSVPTDAGFYNAPNQYKDVENFIIGYGSDDLTIEDTIPEVAQTEDAPAIVEEFSITDDEEATADTPETEAVAETVTNNDDISSILEAFKKSSEEIIKKARESHSTEAADSQNTDDAEPSQEETFDGGESNES